MRPRKGHTELLATVTSDQIWGSPGGLQDVCLNHWVGEGQVHGSRHRLGDPHWAVRHECEVRVWGKGLHIIQSPLQSTQQN